MVGRPFFVSDKDFDLYFSPSQASTPVVLNFYETVAPFLGKRTVWRHPWLQFTAERYMKFRYWRNPSRLSGHRRVPRYLGWEPLFKANGFMLNVWPFSVVPPVPIFSGNCKKRFSIFYHNGTRAFALSPMILFFK